MRQVKLGQTEMQVPAVALGCMRIVDKTMDEAKAAITTAMDRQANFFDHADIYGEGESERVFGRVVKELGIAREEMILQSKCGIRKGVCYDFSKTHILTSVEGSLQRLGTDYLDILLLHRPDALIEPEEVAEAFAALKQAGKVRHFGVSNFNPMQIALLSRYLDEPICVNQLQLSIVHAHMIGAGLYVNNVEDDALDRDGSVLDYCRLKDITIQPWSPLRYGVRKAAMLESERDAVLHAKMEELAEAYGVTPTTIAIAWLLRHPAGMQPVIGTLNPERIGQCLDAAQVNLTREQWYALYMAAGNRLI